MVDRTYSNIDHINLEETEKMRVYCMILITGQDSRTSKLIGIKKFMFKIIFWILKNPKKNPKVLFLK